MTTHYEVLCYTDDTRAEGQIMAITPDQDHAAEIAGNLKAAGYAHVTIRRMTTDAE